MNYSLGLDIGIASIGWSVLDFDRKQIADLGVRLFTGAEDSQSVSVKPSVPVHNPQDRINSPYHLSRGNFYDRVQRQGDLPCMRLYGYA